MENPIERNKISRRDMLFFLSAVAWADTARAQSTPPSFEIELAKAVSTGEFADMADYREKFVVFPGDRSRAQGGYRGRPSKRLISDGARRLIVACEVTNEAYYRSRLQDPTWPGGQSGVTIGFGSDLGYTKAAVFRSEWGGLLPKSSVDRLVQCCGLKGQSAAQQIKDLHGHTVVWSAANSQFDAYLPYVIGQTEDTFQNCADLKPDSLGALVSLVYNRGASLSRSADSRLEMREIYDLMLKRDFGAIPAQFRKMTRLWKSDPHAKGLLKRRELEALLFEQGMRV